MFRINFLWIAVDHKAINLVYRREMKNMSQTENEKKKNFQQKGERLRFTREKILDFFLIKLKGETSHSMLKASVDTGTLWVPFRRSFHV